VSDDLIGLNISAAKAASHDRQPRVATRLWTSVLSASGRSRRITEDRGADMPSGKSPFIIDHDDATILPVLPEKIIDMMETPIK
jgi:hypothetical protein